MYEREEERKTKDSLDAKETRDAVNCPEFPNSWNNKEKTKMANFNETINSETGYILRDQDYLIYRGKSMKMFKRYIYDDLYFCGIPYRLFIQYKTTHRVKKMAGRCFLWDNSHCDHFENPGNGIELRSLNDASQDDCEGFGNPRFDGMESAILIADRYVFIYGGVQIEASVISLDKKHVYCDVSLCGSIVSNFRIPAEAFDRFFGLKENFPEQYAKPVQIETKNECEQAFELIAVELINEAKRNIESCKNLLDTHECQLERAMDAIKVALIDIEDQKCELDDMLSKLDNTLRKLKQGFELSGNSE